MLNLRLGQELFQMGVNCDTSVLPNSRRLYFMSLLHVLNYIRTLKYQNILVSLVK